VKVLWSSRLRERAEWRWQLRLERKWADGWVGVFWDTMAGPTGKWATLNVWVCIVPCFPIHVFVQRPRVRGSVR
jgi:hypothetical protein